MPTDPRRVPIFVLMGASKSGTTWLQQVLDSHPAVRCHFQRHILPWHTEVRNFPESRLVFNAGASPFGGLFPSAEEERRYNAVHEYLYRSAFLRGEELETAVRTLSSEHRQWVTETYERMLAGAIAGLLADVDDKAVYGTKAATDIPRFLRLFPEGKVIHLIRDGRDVTVSKRFHMLRRGVFYAGDERFRLHRLIDKFEPTRKLVAHALRRTPTHLKRHVRKLFVTPPEAGPLLTRAVIEKFAGDWRALVEFVQAAERERPASFLTLRYEDLQQRPEQEIARAFEFLGVDSGPAVVATVVRGSAVEKERLKTVSNSFLRKGEVGDWRNHFDEDAARIFDEVAGQTLINLGYAADSEWVREASRQ